jgi:hypothetical protein
MHCVLYHKPPEYRHMRSSAKRSCLHSHKLCSSLACAHIFNTASFSMKKSSRLPSSHVSLTLSLMVAQSGNHGSTCAFSAISKYLAQHSPVRDTASTPHMAQYEPAVNVWSASPFAMDMPHWAVHGTRAWVTQCCQFG